MDIQAFAKKHKTEIAAIGLLVGGSTGPITDLLTTIGLDWNQVVDVILATDLSTLVLWAVIAALYFSKGPSDDEIREKVIGVLKEKDL